MQEQPSRLDMAEAVIEVYRNAVKELIAECAALRHATEIAEGYVEVESDFETYSLFKKRAGGNAGAALLNELVRLCELEHYVRELLPALPPEHNPETAEILMRIQKTLDRITKEA